MIEIKCLKDSETKKYIIPTNDWLIPLKPLSEFSQKLNLENIKLFMKQLIFGLMHAFQANGFIHGKEHYVHILNKSKQFNLYFFNFF